MKRVGILTSGGDAPGMNAAIRAVTRTAIYNGLEVIGFRRGYEGLLDGDVVPLSVSSVGGIVHRGGTMLRTARCERFIKPEGVREGLQRLKEYDIDALVVVGGDGSFHGAYDLHKLGFPVVGIPGTIDNDMAGTDCTIGFDTACNTALQCVVRLRDTASSHDRLFIIEVMGRNAGFLALEVAVASGAEYVVVPELPLSIGNLCQKLRVSHEKKKSHTLIILAEGVMRGNDMKDKLQDTGGYDARVTVLGYIQRGGSPSSFDVILASRMGAYAAESLFVGKSGVMVGNINHRMVLTDLERAWSEQKNLSPELLGLMEKLN